MASLTAAALRLVPGPICCCSIPRRSVSLRRAGSMICLAAACARCAIRSACTVFLSMAFECSTARTTPASAQVRGRCSTAFCRPARLQWRARPSKGGVAMPVDPQIQALLDKGTGVPATHTLPVDVARAQYEARIALMAPPADIAAVCEQTIEGPGGPLRLRIYTPHDTSPFPLLVFFHGSGFVLCSLDTHDGMCRNLFAGAGCVVASVDYRLAPEHKFPAGIDDCLHATRWAAVHALELGADPTRIAVGGDSAGGNMAAVIAIRVRDEGGPGLCGQLLLYPVTDYHTPGTPSYEENAEGYGLTRDTMEWFWGHYLRDPSEAAHPHASPLRAADLSGLPPALIITSQYDPLRDEGELYAERLKDVGVMVSVSRYEGANHGFMFWVGLVDKAGEAMEESCKWLRGVFAGSG